MASVRLSSRRSSCPLLKGPREQRSRCISSTAGPPPPPPPPPMDTILLRRRGPSVCCRHKEKSCCPGACRSRQAGSSREQLPPQVYQRPTGAALRPRWNLREKRPFHRFHATGSVVEAPSSASKHLYQHDSNFTDQSSGTDGRRGDGSCGEGGHDGSGPEYQSEGPFGAEPVGAMGQTGHADEEISQNAVSPRNRKLRVRTDRQDFVEETTKSKGNIWL